MSLPAPRLYTNLVLTSLATATSLSFTRAKTKHISRMIFFSWVRKPTYKWKLWLKYFATTAVICKRWKKLIQHKFQHFNNCSRNFLLTFVVIHHLTNYMRINYGFTKSNQEKMFWICFSPISFLLLKIHALTFYGSICSHKKLQSCIKISWSCGGKRRMDNLAKKFKNIILLNRQ